MTTRFDDTSDLLDRAIQIIRSNTPPEGAFETAVKKLRVPDVRLLPKIITSRNSMVAIGSFSLMLIIAVGVFCPNLFIAPSLTKRDSNQAIPTNEVELPKNQNELTNPPVPSNAVAGAKSLDELTDEVVTFVRHHCIECHGPEATKGGIAFDKFLDAKSIRNDRALWETALTMVHKETMPPPLEENQLARTDRDRFLLAADRLLRFADPELPNPQPLTVRRLNQIEYVHTINDLFKVNFQPASDFPPDNSKGSVLVSGSDLAIAPSLIEGYRNAADFILKAALPETGQSAFRNSLMTAAGSFDREIARGILERVARQAYRRPVDSLEISGLMKTYDEANSNEVDAVQSLVPALKQILVAKPFLLRYELDDRSPSEFSTPIDEFQLAARLSFFLCSSSPDKELLDLAARGELNQDLERQVRRLIRSDYSTLTDVFAFQWLGLRKPKNVMLDRKKFPEYTDELGESMNSETLRFFDEVRMSDRSIVDLLDGKFTYLNERLADHYGIADTKGNRIRQSDAVQGGQPIKGEKFVRVELQNDVRSGLLTQASIMTVTAYPGRTSPVNRGRWVLDQFFNTPTPPPPPPPAKIPPLDDQGSTSGSLRQLMDQHATDSFCAACHAKMDAIGYALENFDVVGRFRELERGFEIDARGEMPDGTSFNGPTELKAMLVKRKDQFTAALAEKLMSYALGRKMAFYDQDAVSKIVKGTADDEYKFSRLIVEVVKSDPFRIRRGIPNGG